LQDCAYDILKFSKSDRTMTDTVIDWIAHHAITTPDKTATIDLASGRRHNYAQMNERVACIAGFLRKAGVEKGDRVGLIALNSSDVLDIIFATWRIGAVHLALNFRLTAPELAFIVGDAAPKLVIADAVFAGLVDSLKAETPGVQWVETDGLGGDTEFEMAIAAADRVERIETLTPSEQAMLMYSSGTTGRPKGVVLTHGNMVAAVINEAINFEADRNTVSYAVMPLFHIGAMMGFSVPAMFFGATAIVEREFEPGAMLDAITREDYGVTHFLGLPAVYNALAMHPAYQDADFSRIVIAAGGAEPMPEPLLRSWYEHGVPIVEVYGMTEVCGLACSLLREDVPGKIGSAGKAAIFIDMKIMKSDSEEAAPGEQGEIWMRGSNVTPGYWQRPEANEESFVGDWLKSGDIGRKDDQGYIYIDDRIKDMYISGGENVYPAEVENILYMMPQISEVAVVGIADPRWGEVGCAVVVLKEGESLDLDTVQNHCAEHLARYKHPQRLVIQTELPRNATGKVLKFQIRENLQ
jgi:fatty-acyl-CoA synthase